MQKSALQSTSAQAVRIAGFPAAGARLAPSERRCSAESGWAMATCYRGIAMQKLPRLVPIGFLDNLCAQLGMSHEILVITHSGADTVSTPNALGRDSAPR